MELILAAGLGVAAVVLGAWLGSRGAKPRDDPEGPNGEGVTAKPLRPAPARGAAAVQDPPKVED